MIADDIRVRQTFSPDGYSFEKADDFPQDKLDTLIVRQCFMLDTPVPEPVRKRMGDDAVYAFMCKLMKEGVPHADFSTKIKETDHQPGMIEDMYEHGLLGEENKDRPSTAGTRNAFDLYKDRLVAAQTARLVRHQVRMKVEN